MGELRRAIEQGELVLHYQPKVRPHGRRARGRRGAGALAAPRARAAPAGEFIPLAEHTALIKSLTLYVVDRALEECGRWQRDGHTLSVAVNISARNLLDAGFADAVAASLQRWGLARTGWSSSSPRRR